MSDDKKFSPATMLLVDAKSASADILELVGMCAARAQAEQSPDYCIEIIEKNARRILTSIERYRKVTAAHGGVRVTRDEYEAAA